MHFLGVQTCIKHVAAADMDLRLYPGGAYVLLSLYSKLVFNCH